MPTATITQTSLHFTAGPPMELHGRARRRAVPIICPAPADVRATPWRAVEIAGAYTFLGRDNLSSPSTPLTETPRHKALVSVMAGPFARIRGMLSVEAEAGRETLNEGGHYYDVPSFAVVNAKVSWHVAGRFDVDLSGLNLTDRNYWVVDGYPESGRVVRLSASWRF